MASRQTIRKGKRALAKAEIKTAVTIKGFHTVTLTLNNIKATTAILTEVFDYKQIEQEDNLYRYQTDAVENAASVDLLEMPQAQRGLNAGGTKVRLGDTELFIQIENDYHSGHYGEEITFGGGKNVRDGMAQSSTKTRDQGVLDFVIINVVVIDHWGIVKGDVGIKDGKIVGIGKAGNPDTIDGVTENMIIDASTEVHSGAGHILTAGGIDTHVHFISPQQVDHALLSSVTTMIGGGSGPADGTSATLVTSGAWHIEKMIQATENFLMNVGFFGKGNCSTTAPLIEQIEAGALGLKVHEDWGATPAAIDASLTVADEYDIQVALHADSLNESGFLEDTVNAINGRTIHTFHTEGAGGGHAPDIMKIASHPDVLPSSTNPTRPFTVNTVDEH